MPRANRHFIPGHVWHITHRCHKQEFLFKFSKDRNCWLKWLFEAKKRYGLCVLNYIVTSNHIHLLVFDNGGNSISKSMQLIAGRTAQQYNRRKKRKGAFWEDRYHATAIEAGAHLAKCMVYVDLNMVRTGKVKHPSEWPMSGYNEIHEPPIRKSIIDINTLLTLFNLRHQQDLQQRHSAWVEDELKQDKVERNAIWSESVAVGSEKFVTTTKKQLGILANGRSIKSENGSFQVREIYTKYGHFDLETGHLRSKNCYFWDESLFNSCC